MISKCQRNKTVKRSLKFALAKIFTFVMICRLRKLALFDASTIENIDKICKYYGTNRILVLII